MEADLQPLWQGRHERAERWNAADRARSFRPTGKRRSRSRVVPVASFNSTTVSPLSLSIRVEIPNSKSNWETTPTQASSNTARSSSPRAALSELGNSVTVQALGTEGTLTIRSTPKWSRPPSSASISNNTPLPFLITETPDSLQRRHRKTLSQTAGTRSSRSRVPPAFSTKSTLSLITNSSITSGDPSSRIKPTEPRTPEGLVANNGAEISVSNLDFSENAYIHAGGSNFHHHLGNFG